jgi:DNA-binding winged helix-turn-helix (wHTH) protein/predicted ATPase
MRYCFGAYTLDTHTYELHQAGQPVQLQPKVFELLTYLIQHRTQVVTRQELLETLWSDQFVSNDALERAVAAVRKAVGDSGRAQQVIQTVYGRGYRFVAPVEEEPHAPQVQTPLEQSAIVCEDAETRRADTPLTISSPADLPDDHQGASPPGRGERKPVTVLAFALSYDETRVAGWDPEALYTLRHRFFTLAQREVQRYGGTIQYVDEASFVAFFGAPRAYEDHAQRAVMAALNLQERLRQQRDDQQPCLEDEPTVHMGLHTGPMIISRIGDDQRQIAMALGDTMQVARQLVSLAAPGAIVLSDATKRLVHGLICYETIGAACREELVTPVMAHQVLGWAPQSALTTWHGRRVLHPLVGREREMATFQALLEQVLEGRGQVVGIAGEPGIGKSRLLYEFRQRVLEQPCAYLAARCVSYGAATPYLPLFDLVRYACGLTETDAPDTIALKVHEHLQKLGMALEAWAPYVLALLGIQEGTEALAALSPAVLRSRSFEALLQMLQHQSQQGPLMLEVEDLHWIDPTSEAWLVALVERLAGVPIMLLVSYRPGYQPPWMAKAYATQLALQRLTPHESWRMLQDILAPSQAPSALVWEIISKADGNPFFLEELAQAVVERGASHQPLGMPETIEAVLVARMDRLPSEAKRVLQLAAVVGRECPVALLQRLTALPEATLSRILAQLQMADLLYETRPDPERMYTFKHALVQEAVYHTMLQSTRRQVHENIAHILAEAFPQIAATQPERLAHHFTEAALPAQALSYWQQAGEHAFAGAAHIEAIAHLTKGLALLPALPDTPERSQDELDLLLALGRALIHAKGHASSEVKQVFIRAHELCQQGGTPQQHLLALSGLRDCYIVRAELQTAHELAEQCLHLASRMPNRYVLSGAHSSHGGLLFCLGDFAAARASLEQGIAHYQGPQSHRAQTLRMGADTGVTCRAWASVTLWALGYPDQAQQRSREARTLAQALSHPYSMVFALFFAALLHYCCREVSATQESADALLALVGELETQYSRPQGMAFRGWTLAMQHQGEDGLALIHQGLAAYRATGGGQWLSLHLMLLAEGYRVTGQAETGCRVLTEAQAIVTQSGVRCYEAELYRLQGELLLTLSSDYRPRAEACFQRALEVAQQQQARSLELRAAMSLCRLYRQQGKGDMARQRLAGIFGWFTEGLATPPLQEAAALLQALA